MKISTETLVDSKTGEIVFIDNRIFSECVAYQLQELKRIASEKILAVAPEFKQTNAALGILSQEETQVIKDHIQTIRTQANLMETQINSISWDGQESTRSTACDAVQSIFWP